MHLTSWCLFSTDNLNNNSKTTRPMVLGELRAIKQLRRALERKWRQTTNDDDRTQYREQCAMVAKQYMQIKTLIILCPKSLSLIITL